MMKQRNEYIGSADISAIVGVNPYQSALDVYNAKVNGIVQEENERMKWGLRLEKIILEDIPHTSFQAFAQHPLYEFICGTADAYDAFNVKKMHEIKTTALANKSKWKKEIPQHYQVQAHWLMGLHQKIFCDFDVLFGGQKLEVYTLEFDEDIYNYLINEARRFWNEHIIPKIPPRK